MKANKDIEKVLKATESIEPESRDDFWTTFRARAARIPQTPMPRHTFYRRHESGIRWATAAASLAVISGVVFFNLRPATAYADTVRSIEINVPYTSMLIMNDDAARATIVWIEGL